MCRKRDRDYKLRFPEAELRNDERGDKHVVAANILHLLAR